MEHNRGRGSLTRRYLAALPAPAVVDVTARKQTVEALNDSRRYLQALFDNSLDGILVTNDEARYIDANPAACALLGYTHAELMQLNILDLTAVPYREKGWGRWQEFLAKGSQSGEYSALRKDGTVIQLEFRAVANILPGIHLSVSRDVTERKRAEQAQREAERKYRDIFENALEGIFQTSPEGRFMVANPALASMFGFDSPEELIRETADISKQHYVDPKRREEFIRLLEVEGIVHHFDYEAYRKDGSKIWVSANVRAVRDGKGRVLCYEGRAEETLRSYSRQVIEAQEAERQHIARELHDQIGQVLTAIRINLQTIRNSCETEESRSLIDQGMGIIDAALEQVRNLSFELRPSLLDDLGLVAALRWYSDQYTQRTGIRTRSVSALPGGQTRLREELETACFRIVQEALTNVVRHANAKNVSIDLRKLDHKIVLSIKDDGIGFKERTPDGDASAIRLGLRGMRERALAVGGTLEIESAPARGTEIRAYLPTESKGE